jgi:mono/diheme cytochrome c family protein
MNALASRGLVLATLGLLSLACSKPKPQEGSDTTQVNTAAVAPAAAPSPSSQAKQIYDTRCSACHGSSGKGDGPGAAALDPKPRNFADATWQAAVTDEQIAKVIKEGGPAVGKSPGMPGNPDLSGKDDVLTELVKLVRDSKG